MGRCISAHWEAKDNDSLGKSEEMHQGGTPEENPGRWASISGREGSKGVVGEGELAQRQEKRRKDLGYPEVCEFSNGNAEKN